MKIYNDIIQGTEEWVKIRLGKFTGSNFHIFLKGTPQKIENEIYKKASEIIIQEKCESDIFSNRHTERGHELEFEAKSIYELETNNIVTNIGFIELNKFVGCSPDGLISKDGIIEIKCKDNHTFLKYKMDKKIEAEYITQIQFNLFVSERKFCDFIVYNPNFKQSLLINRIYRDDKYIQEIRNILAKNIKKIKKIINEYGRY